MEDSAIVEQIAEALESRGYANMTNGKDIGALLDRLEAAETALSEIWQPVAPEGWFLDSASHGHTRIIYNGDKHEPLPHVDGPWKVEFQRLPHGGRLTGARGKTLREAWDNACIAVANRT